MQKSQSLSACVLLSSESLELNHFLRVGTQRARMLLTVHCLSGVLVSLKWRGLQAAVPVSRRRGGGGGKGRGGWMHPVATPRLSSSIHSVTTFHQLPATSE